MTEKNLKTIFLYDSDICGPSKNKENLDICDFRIPIKDAYEADLIIYINNKGKVDFLKSVEINEHKEQRTVEWSK